MRASAVQFLTHLYPVAALADGRYDNALVLATRCLYEVDRLPESQLPNKAEINASLHSCIGNAHLEKGHYDKALVHHNKDRALALTQ